MNMNSSVHRKKRRGRENIYAVVGVGFWCVALKQEYTKMQLKTILI